MSLFFYFDHIKIPGITSITCLSERGNPRGFFGQAGSTMILNRACEVGRCQNRSTMKKSRCRAQRSTWRQSQKTQRATAACQGTIGASRDIECPGCLTVFWLTSDRKYRAGCFSIVAIYLRRVSPPSLFRGDRLCRRNRHHNKPAFVAGRAGALRNYFHYRDTTSSLDWSRKWKRFF